MTPLLVALTVVLGSPGPESTLETAQRAERTVAVLRGLDKFSGQVTDLIVAVGAPIPWERLTVTVRACRAEPGDPQDAAAFLEIEDRAGAEIGAEAARVFSGWMFAAEPSLSALDHPRYDVWLAACRTASGGAS